MNRRILLFFSILTPLILLAISSRKVAVSSESTLPESIDEYYRDYNYLTLFSSEIEREVIADSLMCEGRLDTPTHSELNFCDEIPTVPNSERLSMVRALITELSEEVLRYPNLVSIQEYMPGEGSYLRNIDPEMQPFRRNPYAQPSELLGIEQISRDDNAIIIRVAIYQLDPSINAQLISQYEAQEESGSEIPSSETLLKLASPIPIIRHEYHNWINEDETWRKLETSFALMKNHSLY